jgi:predicted Ser/Thr protein kinase
MTVRPQPGEAFGDYHIIAELGKGGMGRVFRAHHLPLDRDVALKVLDDPVAGDESFRSRFLKEARSAARLNHRNIVQIYDFGQVDGTYYLAMEFVAGRSLGAILRSEGPFSERHAVGLVREACTALGTAHAAGIVHRDVKPDNLILTEDGVVKLVDLGLAKSVVDDQNATQTGVVAGTPHYISPEQIEGRRDIDGRADVYSLGATLFHLVTGKPPFEGSSPMVVIAKHLHEEPGDPRELVPDLSDALCAVIRRMMARDRDDRYPDMAALEAVLRDLEGAHGDTPPSGALDLSAVATIASGSAASFPSLPSVDADLMHAIETHLAAAIGPLARLLVRNAARRSSDPDALCAEVSRQIASAQERAAFLAAVHADPAWPHPRPAAAAPPASTDRTVTSVATALTAAPQPVTWSPESLAALERLLATAIGPMAKVLVKRSARHAGTWDQLATSLASSLPPGSDAEAFLAAAAKLLH